MISFIIIYYREEEMPSKKLFLSLILPLLFAASCIPTVAKPGSPANAIPPTTFTESPTISSATLPPQSQPTLTPQSQPTLTPQSQPTLTPQPQSTISPQQQSNCTDSASFVADVTVPDNTKVDQGKTFVKTWRIRNTGTCTWDTNYSMVFVNGDQMNSVATIPFKVTPPGGALDVSVNLVAPSADGVYTGNYEFQNASGQTILIDDTKLIWVKITVASNNTQQPNPTPGAALGSQAPVAGTSGDCSFFENSLLENELISLINSVRVENGLPTLAFNKKLAGAAIGHSIDMACHSSISHTGSNGSSITDRFAANGYSYTYWNEAIYAQPPEYGGNAQAAVDWWLNDPPHRVILLSSDAKDIGAGYVYVSGSKLGGYFTIDVGAH
jgi:uncharacterized protein YkwD